MKQKWPRLRSDDEAERFVERSDLTRYDFSRMKQVRFEVGKTLRPPSRLSAKAKPSAAPESPLGGRHTPGRR